MFGEKEDYFEIIGNRLKSIREEIGFSQVALSVALEEEYHIYLTQASISKLEKNLNGQIKNFIKILEFYSSKFNYNINWVITPENDFISKKNMDVTDLGINQQEIQNISTQLREIANLLDKS